MPANKKYLSNPRQRALKITAGILGGLIVTILFHNAFAVLLKDNGWLIITSAYSSFILWAALMIVAFISKNGWKVWGVYLSLIIVFSLTIFLFK